MAVSGWARACIVLWGFAALGCGDDGNAVDPFATLTPDPAFPGTPGDAAAYASLFQFEPLPGCAVPNPTDLQGTTELRLFRSAGVTDAEVRGFTSGLQRYYSQYGVAMSTRYSMLTVPFDSALTLDLDALAARVKAETGLDINGPLTGAEGERATAAAGAAILWNVREMIRVYGEPRRDVLNVVVLPSIAGTVPDEFENFRNMAGLGLSSEFLANVPEADPARQLYDWLGVDGEFTPIALVGARIVRDRPDMAGVVIAHEVGHAYGLVHVPGSGTNLMNPAAGSCALGLNDGQLDDVAAATSAIAHGAGVESVSLTTRAGEFVMALHRFVRTRAEKVNAAITSRPGAAR